MRCVHLAGLMTVVLVLLLVWASVDTLSAQQPAVGGAPPAEAAADNDGAEARERDSDVGLFTLIRRGGILMIPIALCSIATLAFMIERLIGLRRSQVMPAGFLRSLGELLNSSQVDNGRGMALCDDHPSPVARILHGAFKKAGRPHTEVQKAVEDAGEREVNRMKQNVRVLSMVANIAPLLGLLGTVIGMIRAFAKIRSEAGLGKPELLAGGIYEALVTTAAGLTVAIPALAMYHFLSHRVDKMIREIDDLSVDLVDTLAMPET